MTRLIDAQSDGMAHELKEYFKEYKGCRNCKHQPQPMLMCEWGKHRKRVELICSGWERRKEHGKTD